MKYKALATLLGLALCLGASAQVQRDTVKVYFQQGKSEFDPFYRDNGRRLVDFTNRAKAMQRDTLVNLERLVLVAASSPEGLAEKNEKLTYSRASSIVDYLHTNLNFDENALEVYFNDLDYDLLASLVRADEKIPEQQEFLAALAARDITLVKVPRWQKTWDYLLANVFPEMRFTQVVFEYKTIEPKPAGDGLVSVAQQGGGRGGQYTQGQNGYNQGNVNAQDDEDWWNYVPALPDDDEVEELDFSEPRGWSMYVKTNLLPWALFEANLALEFEIGRHLSFSLPFYYSGADWFKTQNKFRVMGTQPELRFWFRDDFSGPFLAAHGTFGYYNIALASGEYRFQDRDGKTPAYGAGGNVGWKFRLDRKRADRWGLELVVGGGWLHLDYDRFYNEENGRLADSVVKDYYGIDNASIAITYRFGK